MASHGSSSAAITVNLLESALEFLALFFEPAHPTTDLEELHGAEESHDEHASDGCEEHGDAQGEGEGPTEVGEICRDVVLEDENKQHDQHECAQNQRNPRGPGDPLFLMFIESGISGYYWPMILRRSSTRPSVCISDRNLRWLF